MNVKSHLIGRGSSNADGKTAATDGCKYLLQRELWADGKGYRVIELFLKNYKKDRRRRRAGPPNA